MAIGIIVLLTVGMLVVICSIYVIIIFNGLVSLKNNMEKAAANIDVLLNQRANELPNLVATVKGYMKHEKHVLTEVTKVRAAVAHAHSMHEKADANQQLDGLFKTLFAVAEGYPQLRASENFLALQQRISDLESAIADRREFYNDSTTTYNIRIDSVPDVLIARMFHFTRQELFEATPAEKKPVSVDV